MNQVMNQDNQIQAEVEQNNQEMPVVDLTTATSPDVSNKKTNWLWVVLGFAVIAILIIAAVWQTNTKEPIVVESDDHDPNVSPSAVPVASQLSGIDNSASSLVNDELRGTVEFAIRETLLESGDDTEELVAISKTGTQTTIYQWVGLQQSTSKPYAVTHDKVYIQDYDQSFQECYLGVIDLTAGDGNYKLTKIKDLGNCLASEFAVVGDEIYYTEGLRSLEHKDIYMFNTKTNEDKLVIHSDVGVVHDLFASEQEKVIFYREQVEQVNSIHQYDLKNQLTTLVCADCYVELVNNGKLVYLAFPETNSYPTVNVYFEYDIQTKTTRELFSMEGNAFSVGAGIILPFGSEYFYLRRDVDESGNNIGEVLKINVNLESELVYSVRDSMASTILWSSENSLMVSERRDLTDFILRTTEIDLDGNEISSQPDRYYYYAQHVNY